MIDMIVYYWDWSLAILAISGISSYFSLKVGVFTSALLTLCSIALGILAMMSGAVGSQYFFVLAIFLFPALAWTGFFLGRLLGKKFGSNVGR